MAVSTQVTTLEYGTTAGLGKNIVITSYPDMGSTPSKLDTTDLSAVTYKTSILGLQELPDLTFEANYDEAVFSTLITDSANASLYFKLSFGASDGAFTWQGQMRVYAQGGGVDEVRKMVITLSASTAIVFATT